MPELPDVEVYRSYFAHTSLHQRIEDVEIRDSRLIEDMPAETFKNRLAGRAFNDTTRRGKHLFADTGDNVILAMHFGMTGSLEYIGKGGGEPKYGKVYFNFSGGGGLAYISRRILGRLAIIDDIEGFIDRKELGPDALDISRETFLESVSGRTGAIKSTLMNQSLFAGIGNVYSDEILFQARIHPGRGVHELTEQELDRIYGQIGHVLKTAIEHNADPGDMPSSFLLPRRSPGEQCPGCRGTVEKTVISGRATYFCSSCQSKSSVT